jgi:hypothetical protein
MKFDHVPPMRCTQYHPDYRLLMGETSISPHTINLSALHRKSPKQLNSRGVECHQSHIQAGNQNRMNPANVLHSIIDAATIMIIKSLIAGLAQDVAPTFEFLKCRKGLFLLSKTREDTEVPSRVTARMNMAASRNLSYCKRGLQGLSKQKQFFI